MENYVLGRTDGPVAFLRLNRPEKRNALTPAMLEFIEQQTASWERDASMHVLVIEGSGPTFCAGADIEFLATLDECRMREWEFAGNRVLDRIENSRLISIASLNGPAMGGGLTLAAACDLRMAVSDAVFGQPEIDLGWIPGWSGVRRLARCVGGHRAKQLCLTGERIHCARAQEIGLLDAVVPAGELNSTAAALAQRIASNGAAAGAIKLLADHLSADHGPGFAHHFDALVNSSLLHSEKGRAMIRNFLEKRSSAKA
jgi:enoyl-CoA hydratase/carnithine racemase